MTRPGVRATVWTLALVGLAVTGAAVVFPQTPGTEQPPLWNAVFGDVYLALGCIVFWQRPHQVLPRVMIGLGLIMLGGTLVQIVGVHFGDSELAQSLAWLSVASYLAFGFGLGLLVHLFPTGQPPSPGWRWPVRALVAGTTGLIIGEALGLAASRGPLVAVGTFTLGALYTVGLLAAIPSLGWRFWRSRGAERAQVKWFLFAVVVATVGWFTTTAAGAVLTLLLPPLAITVALTRYRLYDVDRLISRTASYVIVTGLVLATYALVVTSVTRLLPDSSTLAVAAATLAAAALARPLLRRVQDSVDRRFNRAGYDAQQTVERFGGRLRDEVATDLVMADLRTVVAQTLTPTTVSVWLRDA
jgi:hypothetical protein